MELMNGIHILKEHKQNRRRSKTREKLVKIT